MEDLLPVSQKQIFLKSSPCTTCHSKSSGIELGPDLLSYKLNDAFSRLSADGLQFKRLSPEQKKSREKMTQFLGDFGNEMDLLEKATIFQIDPADYEEDHPLALLHNEFVSELAPDRSALGKKVTISFGDNYWTNEDRELGKSGDVAKSLAAIPVGSAAFAGGTALATGAGVVSGILVTASGLIVAVVIVAGVSYLIHLGIQAADDSSVEVTPYIGDMDMDEWQKYDLPSIDAVAITKKDDYVVPYANQAQSLLYVLDEDGMLREIESQVKHGNVFPVLNGDQFDLDVTGQRAINDAWSQLRSEVKAANQEQGKKTQYEEVIAEEMTFAGDPYSWWTSREVKSRKIPVVPASMNSGLENFSVSVTDADGNRVNSHEADRVLRSLEFKGRNPDTGRKEYDVNPVYQLVVANRLRQAMMSIDDKKALYALSSFASKQLYSMKDRSFHAASKDVNEMDPQQQQYDKLYEHIRILYEDALKAMKKKASGNDESLQQAHMTLLGESILVAREYSNNVNAKVYGEAFSELKLEQGTRIMREYSFESFSTMFDQANFNDFKAWAFRNEDKFLKFISSNEKMAEGLGLDVNKETKLEDLSDEQVAKVFLLVKDQIVARQRVKAIVLVNLVYWLEKNNELLKDAPLNLIADLKKSGIQKLNDEQLDFLIQVTGNKREEILELILKEVERQGPREVRGKMQFSGTNSENRAKTVNEALFDLRYIDDATRDKNVYLEQAEIDELVAADREKTIGFETKVIAAWLGSNQAGKDRTLDLEKLENIFFDYVDLVAESDDLVNKDRKSDIVLALSDYITEDVSRLALFQADHVNEATGVDDFKSWLVDNNGIQMKDKTNGSINALRLEILQTLQYIESNAKKNPFATGLFAQIRQ